MERRKVLLLGNGVNRIDNDYSWENLMHDLLAFANMDGAISVKDKPFPLLYEEIYLRWLQDSKSPEMELKQKIRELVRNIRSNALHRKALQMDVDEILTTNYDHNLEAVLPGGLKAADYIPPVKGSKYSLLRRRRAGDKVIWHIHGEASAPGSILLGYEQYAGYLQTIRNYMISGMQYEGLEFLPLNRRLRNHDREVHSWVDHFFHSDVYIMGLNMDFVEMHLWWILDFRARLLRDQRYNIRNRVVFMYPWHESIAIKPRIDLLCACGVGCIPWPVENGDWKRMYSIMLDYVSKRKPDGEEVLHP